MQDKARCKIKLGDEVFIEKVFFSFFCHCLLSLIRDVHKKILVTFLVIVVNFFTRNEEYFLLMLKAKII